MFTQKQIEVLSSYIKSKIDHCYDQSLPIVEDKELQSLLNVPHKGFYVDIIDAKDENVVKRGTLSEGLTNIVASVDNAIQMIYDFLKMHNIPRSKVQTSTFYITVILDVQYISNPMEWDETKDGVYFMWGQDFRALYLPHEIQRMNLSKIEILDRLCSLEAKVPSSLWKSPCGLIFRMSCFSFKS